MCATLLQRLDRQAAVLRDAASMRERLKTLAVVFEAVDPLIEERGVRQPIIEQVAADGAEPDDVGPGLGMNEKIGAAGHFVLAQDRRRSAFVRGACERCLTRVASTGWALGRIAADDDDQIGLFDVA